jgi:hypothetical protein
VLEREQIWWPPKEHDYASRHRTVIRRSTGGNKPILIVEDDLTIGSFLVEAIAQETPYRAIVATDSYQETILTGCVPSHD